MKSIFVFLALFISVLMTGCSGGHGDFIFENYDEYKIDSVVHVFHKDSMMDEYEVIEENELLNGFVNGDDFSLNDLQKLDFYFNQKKVYEGESIQSINSAIKLVDMDKKEEHTKCLAVYRDLLLYYGEGNFKGCIKICFSCGQFLVNDFDPTYLESVKESGRKIEVDYSQLSDALKK
jgi:hypothetical protein